MKYYSIRWKNGDTVIVHDTWDNVKDRVIGVSGVTYKGHLKREDAEAWLNQAPIPYRKVGDSYKKDTLYLFVDGSFSPKRNVSGWGWVAVLNDKKIAEGYGVIHDVVTSRNICGELQATIEAVQWCLSYKDFPSTLAEKPVIVHDYSGIGNWALGYWSASKPVAVKYQNFMASYAFLFNFEKVSGHKGIKWNEYADELTRKGYAA